MSDLVECLKMVDKNNCSDREIQNGVFNALSEMYTAKDKERYAEAIAFQASSELNNYLALSEEIKEKTGDSLCLILTGTLNILIQSNRPVLDSTLYYIFQGYVETLRMFTAYSPELLIILKEKLMETLTVHVPSMGA